MGKFNTTPGNSSAASAAASSSGFFGIYPTLAPDLTYLALDPTLDPDVSPNLSHWVSGFDGDADVIELPSSPAADLLYFDSSGNQVTDGSWSGGIDPVDLGATASAWSGFMRDTSGLIYMVAVDVSTSPDTYFLGTVNKAGTIVQIGNDQPSADAGTHLGWGKGNSTGSTSIYRTADGTGNIFVRFFTSTVTLEAEINIADGQFVTNFTQVAIGPCPYKTAAGTFIGNFANTGSAAGTSPNVVVDVSGSNGFSRLHIPDSTGAPGAGTTTGGALLQWGGKIVLAANASNGTGPKAFAVSTFDNWTNRLLATGGVT